jgi:hypothetical protein
MAQELGRKIVGMSVGRNRCPDLQGDVVMTSVVQAFGDPPE